MFPSMGAQPPKLEEPDVRFAMTELDAELCGSEGAEKRIALIERLRVLDEQVAITMRTGSAPTEFMRDRILREALACAQDVVVRFR